MAQTTPGVTYLLVLYVEDLGGRDDGALRFIATRVPPGLSNGFLSFPAAAAAGRSAPQTLTTSQREAAVQLVTDIAARDALLRSRITAKACARRRTYRNIGGGWATSRTSKCYYTWSEVAE